MPPYAGPTTGRYGPAGGYPAGSPPFGPPPGAGGPAQHAWRTPSAGPASGPPTTRPRKPPVTRTVIVLVAIGLLLLALFARTSHLSSTEVIFFCVLVPAIILHELAHGVVALAFGDDTAQRAGRLSLNPLRHVDIFGTIIMPIITIIAGIGPFGWAKPVPVDARRLRHPRNQIVLVSLAGPLTNVALSALFGLVFALAFANGPVTLAARIVVWGGVVNLWVAAFNMLPIPPFDGSALLERLLPARLWPGYLRIRQMGFIVVIGLLLIFNYSRSNPVGWLFTHVELGWLHLFDH